MEAYLAKHNLGFIIQTLTFWKIFMQEKVDEKLILLLKYFRNQTKRCLPNLQKTIKTTTTNTYSCIFLLHSKNIFWVPWQVLCRERTSKTVPSITNAFCWEEDLLAAQSQNDHFRWFNACWGQHKPEEAEEAFFSRVITRKGLSRK